MYMRLLSFFVITFYFAAPAFAAESQLALLSRVETYLNTITTIQANFVQVTAEGNLATGKFYLKRPGKMRWQYDPPVPVLMVSSGNTLTYYDYELEQKSEIPLDETLAGFLAQAQIRFDPKVIKVLSAESKDKVIHIKITQAKRPEDGALTLELGDHPLELRNFIIRDAQGKETSVSLSNARYAVNLDDDLFLFKDPRKSKWPTSKRGR